MSAIAAEQVTIIRAGLDPSNYVQGAAAIEAANANLVQSGEQVATTDEKLRRGRASAQTSFERLRRELDENARAQERYEAAQRTVLSAVERGRVSQEEANRVLDLARARHEAVARAAEARAQAEEAAARRTAAANAAASQGAFNQVLGVRQPTGQDDYAKRAADMAAFGAEMDRVRAKYDPLFAASKRYEGVLEEIGQAERQGAISARLASDARARATAEFEKAIGPVQSLGAANENTRGGMQRFGQVMGQAGFQLQDFAVQVAGGQSALVALSQQGSQMLGVFGTGGAIAGAVLAVGVLAAQILGLAAANDNAAKAIEAQEAAYKTATDAGERYRSGLEEERQSLEKLAAYYATLSEEVRKYEEVRIRAAAGRVDQQRAELQNQITAPAQGILQASGAVDTPSYDALGNFQGYERAIGAATERMQQLTAATQAYEAAGRPTLETNARLLITLQDLSTGTDQVAARSREMAAQLLTTADDTRKLAESARLSADQLAALRGETTQTGAAARNAAAGVSALTAEVLGLSRASADTSLKPLRDRVENLNSEIAAARQGAQALARARSENRANDEADRLRDAAVEAEGKRLRATMSAEDAAKPLEEFRQQAEREAEAIRRGIPELQRLEEGHRAAGRAAAAGAREARAAQAAAARDEREDEQLRIKILGSKAEAEYRYAQFAAEADQALRRGLVTQEEHTAALERNNPLTQEAARILEQIRTPAEKYAEQLERLRVLLDAGKLTQEQFNAAVERFDPAVKAAEEAAKRQQQAIETANRGVTDNIVRYSADSFADLFDKNGKGWKGMLDTFLTTFRRTMARIAAEAIIRPIVQPIVQYLDLGSTFGSGLAVSGGAGQQAQAGGGGGGGGLMGYAQQAGQAYSFYNKLGSANPGAMMSPGYSFNTGWGAADGVLNTPLWGGGYATTEALGAGVNATGYIPGTALSGEAGAFAGGGGAMSPAMSVGSAAMGAAGVIGGAYGAYAGIKRGGVGGYTQAAGGAATAGMSAMALAGYASMIPVYGWIAAAALMIIGALLPGQKPSDRTGTFELNTRTGATTVGGLDGDRYSAETRSQAEQIARQVEGLAKQVGAAAGLPGAVDAQFRVGVGARDGVTINIGEYQAQGQLDEEGVNAVTNAAVAKFLQMAGDQTTNEDVRSVIKISGTADVNATLANLEWYNTTYKEMSKTTAEATVATNQFALSMKALRDPWDQAIEKARSLGLATTKLAARQDEATQQMIAARNDSFNATLNDYRVSIAQLDPNAFSPRPAPEGTGGDMMAMAGSNPSVASITFDRFNQQRNADWNVQKNQIIAAGLGDAEIERVRVLFEQLKDLQLKALATSLYRAQEDRAAAPGQYRAGMDVALLRATGRETEASQLEFDTNATASLVKARRDMEDLGFSAQELADGMVKATATVEAQRARMQDEATFRAQIGAFSSLDGLLDREARATGSADTLEGALWSFDRKAILERQNAARDAATDMVQLERTLAAERLAIQRDYSARAAEEAKAANDNRAGTAAGLVTSLADYARGLRTSDASPLNARAQYDLAMRDFQGVAGAAQAGHWTSITRLQSYSDALLSASRGVNGSGTGYVADFDRVQKALAGVADLGADRLTASVMATETRTQTQALLEELQRLRAEVAALRAETAQGAARPVREAA